MASCDFNELRSVYHYHISVLHRDSSEILNLLLTQLTDDFLKHRSIVLPALEVDKY